MADTSYLLSPTQAFRHAVVGKIAGIIKDPSAEKTVQGLRDLLNVQTGMATQASVIGNIFKIVTDKNERNDLAFALMDLPEYQNLPSGYTEGSKRGPKPDHPLRKLKRAFSGTVLEHGPFKLEREKDQPWETAQFYAAGHPIRLTPVKIGIMAVLLAEKGGLVTPKMLARALPHNKMDEDNVLLIRFHIRGIRKEIREGLKAITPEIPSERIEKIVDCIRAGRHTPNAIKDPDADRKQYIGSFSILPLGASI